MQAITETGDGVILSLEVSPASRVEEFPSGYNPWRKTIGISVRAPASDGKANKAVCLLVASRLSLPKNAVQILSGQTSHLKRIRVAGITADDLLSLLR